MSRAHRADAVAADTAGRARVLTVLVLLVLVVAAGAVRGRASRAEPTAPLVDAVGAIVITVADLDRSVAFYTEVLFFEKVGTSEAGGATASVRRARLRLGAESIELHEHRAPRGRPIPAGSRSNDRWFQHIAIVVNDMDQAFLWLRRHRVVPISAGPQRLPDWNPAAGGIRAFYFMDPDGHPLELIQFPPDKGDPRWQGPADRVFLGIDHTAIAAGDTEASLAFYRDRLGLRVAGRSENWGLEQERLSGVPGARVRITTLRAAAGPGVELLEYLAPRDGRPYPADARPGDLVHWRTVLAVRDLPAAARALQASRQSPATRPTSATSPGLGALSGEASGAPVSTAPAPSAGAAPTAAASSATASPLAASPAAAAGASSMSRVPARSPGPMVLLPPLVGWADAGQIIRDPDGHLLELRPIR